ncbi:unnamed protein product [Dovyalis caffra]|uniref:Large ribosomal subunit protein bL9c n=1 Tax=Dovyalis caffra TaxID=77055 RepID=A0AAV1RAV4_9ROSI|nr:unnamed protein product [Dovyalis caffra]
MASPSTAATLSWSSSSWLHSFTGPTNEISKLRDKRMPMLVLAQKKATKTRKDVADLGKKGQLVEVKAGYYRNFLLPTGKAQIVTPGFLKEMRMEEERIEAEKKRVKEEAQQLALIFETVGAFKVKRKGGRENRYLGRDVTSQDLVDIIKAQIQRKGKHVNKSMLRDVDKRIVSLPEIRETGEYIAELKLHPEVVAQQHWKMQDQMQIDLLESDNLVVCLEAAASNASQGRIDVRGQQRQVFGHNINFVKGVLNVYEL